MIVKPGPKAARTASTLPSGAQADNLAAQVRAASRKGPPPVHLWNPPFCGDIDMRIARDGTWFYLGTPIGRAPLVRLFSSILRREADSYYLVTPVEMVGILVDDAPLFAVDFSVTSDGEAQSLHFVTRTEDEVTCDANHPLRVALDPVTGEPAPYVMVRAGLEARIDRKSFYRLVDLGSVQSRAGVEWFGLWSGGTFFPIQPAIELG